MKVNILILFISFSLLSSCKKTVNDNEKPEIVTFTLNTSNAIPGGYIRLNSDISDNNLLKSYKVTVINDFNYPAKSIEETIRLESTTVEEIKNQAVYTINNYLIPIPLNVSAGPYLLKLSVLDEKGNESIEEKVSFEIANLIDQPTLNLTEPTNSHVYSRGDTINIAGLIKDNVALQEVKFECKNTNSTFFSKQFLFTSILTTNFDIALDGNVKIPVPQLSGDYTLTTNIKDTVGNLKRNIVIFSVN